MSRLLGSWVVGRWCGLSLALLYLSVRRGSWLLSVALARFATPRGGSSRSASDRQAVVGRRSRFQSSSGPAVFCAQAQPDCEAAVASLVRPNDVVLEIGCQLGRTTQLLSKVAARVIGVDIHRKPAAKHFCSSQYRKTQDPREAGLPTVELHILDVWDLLALQRVCGGPSPATSDGVSLVVIDAAVILGNDLPLEVYALVNLIGRLFAPTLRNVLVKSRAFASLQHQLMAYPGRQQPPKTQTQTRGYRAVRHVQAHVHVHVHVHMHVHVYTCRPPSSPWSRSVIRVISRCGSHASPALWCSISEAGTGLPTCQIRVPSGNKPTLLRHPVPSWGTP